MYSNIVKNSWRNIIRHKSFSIINIAGLSLGIMACLLISLFIWDEKQFDRFIPNADQVYRLHTESTNNEGTEDMAVVPPVFATTLENFPEVKQTARILMTAENKNLLEAGAVKLYESNGIIADSTFFEVLPLHFIYGQAAQCLDQPNSVVLSDQLSKRLFGSVNPVGRQLIINKTTCDVKGVFEKKAAFHLQFDYILPMASIRPWIPAERMASWNWHQFYTYVKLKPGTDFRALETKFQKEVKRLTADNNKQANEGDKPFFQPLLNVHLYSASLKFDTAVRGNILYVKSLTVIAIFILLIACFNFINLSTAKSMHRAREVGVRKASGAGRFQLIRQFTGETIFLALISMVLAIALAIFFLPWLNNFTGKQIPQLMLLRPGILTILLLASLPIGFLAGFYPALVLSRYSPVKVLKSNTGAFAEPGKIPWLRHSLVVLQFTLSALLIISAIIVYKQVNYLHNKELGFKKEQLMFFPMRGDKMNTSMDAFKQELVKGPGIAAVSIGYGFPGDAVAGDEIMVPKDGKLQSMSATQLMVDYDYIHTLGLELVAGRGFSKAMGTDADHAWMINETAVKELGFGTPAKAIGQTLSWHTWNASNPDSLKTGQIIGVLKDFHYKSLYDKVETAVLQIYPDAAWKVAVKIDGGTAGKSIDYVQQVWNRYSPDYPFEYKFLDENFARMYQSEDKLKSLTWVFTCIAIFIGCMGLFGLASYSAERRRKEIGIRKVLGADIKGVVLLLTRDFALLVLLAILVASPVAWFFMHQWLEDFAYRTSINGWVFAIAAAMVITLALATISFQAIKAAMANPVKSLRTE